MDSQIGVWCIIAEGSVVKRKQCTLAETVLAGSPAKEVREVTETDKTFWFDAKKLYVDLADKYINKGLHPLSQDEWK